LNMKFAVYLYLLFCAGNSFASDTLSVRYLGIDQGLSNNAVTCIYKDHNGFMWFGTYDGLNRYDGYAFHVFRNTIGDSASLLDNHVFCINSDNENKVWAGGGKGVSVYDPNRSAFFTPRFRKVNSSESVPLDDAVLSIKSAGNAMLVGTVHNGLIVFTGSRETGKQIVLPGATGAAYNVQAIEYDSIQQVVWFFVNDLGLYKYETSSGRIAHVASGLTQCYSIFKRSNGDLFIASDSGVSRVCKNIFKRFDPIPEMIVRDIAEDARGALWIATDGNGLWYLPPGASRAQPLSLAGEAINSNSIYDIHIDVEGHEWIGTLRGGVNILEENLRPFKTISYHKGRTEAENDFILSFCEDDRSNLWIGTDGAGLRYWDKQRNFFTKYVHSADAGSVSSNFITCIARDFKNDIWISTWFGGINKLNKSNNTFRHYSCYNRVQKNEERNVWQIYEDRKRRLWASASNTGHLFLYNRLADQFELFDSSLVDLQVLTEDRSGNLWGGNYTSLIKIDP
jgi:ligand-binding sensor domain-containing protein